MMCVSFFQDLKHIHMCLHMHHMHAPIYAHCIQACTHAHLLHECAHTCTNKICSWICCLIIKAWIQLFSFSNILWIFLLSQLFVPLLSLSFKMRKGQFPRNSCLSLNKTMATFFLVHLRIAEKTLYNYI